MLLETALKERRSIRSFIEKSIHKEDICACVAAAQLAASWKNSQTARYYAVTDSALIARLQAEALPPSNAFASKNAACLLVTTFVANRSGFNRDAEPEDELGNMWGSYDAGLAHANLLLKAHELGISSLIMGLRDSDKLRELLPITEAEIVLAVIALGYSEKEATMPKRKELTAVLQFFPAEQA